MKVRELRRALVHLPAEAEIMVVDANSSTVSDVLGFTQAASTRAEPSPTTYIVVDLMASNRAAQADLVTAGAAEAVARAHYDAIERVRR